MVVQNATSHTYNTAATRPFNNDAPNSSVFFVIGVVESFIGVAIALSAARALTTDGSAICGLGINSTTVTQVGSNATFNVLGSMHFNNATIVLPAAGYNYICAIENAAAGTAGATFAAATINAMTLC